MILVSAQQDNIYMLWQLMVQMTNFRRLGIEKDAVVLIGYDRQISPHAMSFQAQTEATVLFYQDERYDRSYAASMYYHLIRQFVEEFNPKEPMFLHDGDVIFRELPDFDALLKNDVTYMSDCANYVGANLYGKPYIELMTGALGLTPEFVTRDVVGGAQVLIKNSTVDFWRTVEHRTYAMRNCMTSPTFSQISREAGRRPDPWMASMWAFLWTLYESELPIATSSELDFTWPVYAAKTWEEVKILHNAGVQSNQAREIFHKGSYANRSPFNDDLSGFSTQFAGWHYAQEVQNAAKLFTVQF